MMNKPKVCKEAIEKAIKIAGGQQILAEKAGVSYQSISNWRTGRSNPSPMMCIKIENAVNGDVSKKDILPDFPWGNDY